MTEKYKFPEDETLARYLAMLRNVLLDARFRAYESDPQIAELLDAVENVPDLLARWPECDENIIIGQLEDYETKYGISSERYSDILKKGPNLNWQLCWGKNEDDSENSV